MDMARLLKVERASSIYFRNRYIDYPFQANIHQLELADFLHCLADMHAASGETHAPPRSFREMVHSRYGHALSEMFFIPYNEKLYSISAETLDPESMGRFLPHIDFSGLLSGAARAVDGKAAGAGYNAEFCYHKDGARAYVKALAAYIPKDAIRLEANCESIDTAHKMARVAGETVRYDRLIISAPLPSILRLTGRTPPAGLLTANKVMVFNLGFDRPSLRPEHWVYYPEPEWVFFRVGHYDNILGQDRMSLYVEVSMPQDTNPDTDALLERALSDLQRAGVTDGHKLVSSARVVLDPAYVHITTSGQAFANQCYEELTAADVVPIGRYGRWKYCSIEDNIVEAYDLARSWDAATNVRAVSR